MSRLFVSLVILLLAGCAPPAEDVTMQDPAEARQQIEQRNADIVTAFNNKDHDAMAEFYTENAISMPPNMSMIQGKEAMRQSAVEMQNAPVQVSNLQLSTMEVEVSGDTAVEVGTYTIDVALPDGSTMTDSGKYLNVWKNEAGSWKLHREIYNSDLPMPGMPGAESPPAGQPPAN